MTRTSGVTEEVVAYLWSHRHAWVPAQEIAAALGVSVVTVYRAVDRLRRRGVRIVSTWEGYRLDDLPRGTLVACPRCRRALGRPHRGIAGRWVCLACGYTDEAEPRSWAPVVVLPGQRLCRQCGGAIRRSDPRAVYCSVQCAVEAGARQRGRGGPA